MRIGLTQLGTRCSNCPREPSKQLVVLKSPVKAEAEFIQVRLVVATASVVGTKQKRFEVADCGMNPFEISNFIPCGIKRDVFQPHVAFVTVTLDR